MTEPTMSRLVNRNPDVLTCIANLSNDEVFTPPAIANAMLDMVEKAWATDNSGENIWANPDIKFLDPATKTGVFLREITRRLTSGLSEVIPDLQERVDHILTKQVYGIGITHLTSLLARRSLYCSKHATSKHSIAKGFKEPQGNIWFEPLQHTWIGGKRQIETADEDGNPQLIRVGGRCKFCRAAQDEYDRAITLESHAYAWIHSPNLRELLATIFGADVEFDVIIGNPPYQLDTGGSGRQATPIYNKFVEQAKSLEPRYLSMVIPARWFTGGMGLNGFRESMLSDGHLRSLVDYIRDKDAFPQVNINGGVCYFLWSRDYRGECDIVTFPPGSQEPYRTKRSLTEFDVFVRRSEAVEILRKVKARTETYFDRHVSTIDPFGFPTTYHGHDSKTAQNNIKIYGSGRVSWTSRSEVSKNVHLIDKWLVLIGRATDGNEKFPLPIWDQRGPFIAGPGEVCSWTYLIAYVAESEQEAKNVISYMNTLFFRFMVSLRKATQDNSARIFAFVPDLNPSGSLTDDELFEDFDLTTTERDYIKSAIRQVDFTNANS